MVTHSSVFMRCVAFGVEVFIFFTSSVDPTPPGLLSRLFCVYVSVLELRTIFNVWFYAR